MKLATRFAPAFVVPALVVGGLFIGPVQANALNLPEVTAAELLASIDPSITGFQGVVTKSSDLGLPQLEMSSLVSPEMVAQMEEAMPDGFEEFIPQLIEQNAFTQALELVAGSHRFRIYASEVGVRVQVLDPMSQRDLIVNQDEFWAYDSRTARAVTGSFGDLVPEADRVEGQERAEKALRDYADQIQLDISNPNAIAAYLLDMVGEEADIQVGENHLAAGRGAYRLIATPQSDVSLVRSVEVSLDAETGLALGVSVFSIEQEKPAFSVAFDSISFETPDPALFSFTPPPGTTVEVLPVPEGAGEFIEKYSDKEFSRAQLEAGKESLRAELEVALDGASVPETLGEGFESVLYFSNLGDDVPLSMLEMELFSDLMIVVPGGTVLTTPLVNILLTDSGEVYAGAVTIDYLLLVAAR